MKYKHILFDMDGTLFDFEQAEITAFTKTFKQLGKKELISKHSLYEEINFSYWELLEKGRITASELRIKRFEKFLEMANCFLNAKMVSDIYISYLAKGTFLIKNAKEIINYLTSSGLKLTIITNGLKDVQLSRINKSVLKNNFEHIFISEIIGFAKPDKRYFELVMSKISDNKSELLIVGDNLSSDIKGGIDYGIDTVWFNQNNKKEDQYIVPTHKISNLLELKTIISNYENEKI